MPAQVPRSGLPASTWMRIEGARRSRSIAFEMVVLSPPGSTSPSRSRSPSGVRISTGSASRARSTAAWAAKSPWLASTPIRSRAARGSGSAASARATSGPALLQQLALRGELGDVVPAHRLAELDRSRSDAIGVVEVSGRLDDRPRPAIGVLGLEDPGADEVPLRAELHHEGGVGRRRDPARAEQRDREPACLSDLLEHLERRPQLLRLGCTMLAAESPEPLDPADDPAQMTNRLHDVPGARLALGANHRRALADPPQGLAEVGRSADERDLEGVLVDVMR